MYAIRSYYAAFAVPAESSGVGFVLAIGDGATTCIVGEKPARPLDGAQRARVVGPEDEHSYNFV